MSSANVLAEKIDALKQQGEHLYDPVRFCVIESLAHRAATQRDSVRELLETKIQRALDTYQANCTALLTHEQTVAPCKEKELALMPTLSALAALRELLSGSAGVNQTSSQDASSVVIKNFTQQLVDQEQQLYQQSHQPHPQVKNSTSDSVPFTASTLKSSVAYQQYQQKKRVDKFIDTACSETPENPGPLNPEILAIRLLNNINALSPEYINRYVGYFETLQWLQQEVSSLSKQVK